MNIKQQQFLLISILLVLTLLFLLGNGYGQSDLKTEMQTLEFKEFKVINKKVVLEFTPDEYVKVEKWKNKSVGSNTTVKAFLKQYIMDVID